MNRLPKTLKKCPIIETNCELRFATTLPDDAVFGVLYQTLVPIFGKLQPTPFPIINIPEAVRKSDPHLKYQAYYQISDNAMTILIGPRCIAFSNHKPYVGWSSYQSYITRAIDLISKIDVIRTIERIGVRYINYFDYPILDKTKIALTLNELRLSNQEISFHTMINKDGFLVNLNVTNNTGISINGSIPKKASMIDIDVSKSESLMISDVSKIMEEAHIIEKEQFFSLLNPEFLASLEPIFEEDKK